MKDIKIKKINQNKNAEKVVEPVVHKTKENAKGNANIFSIFLFGLMTTTVFCYVFLVSSSIFYSVRANRYQFEIENANNVTISLESPYEMSSKHVKKSISYINQDSETSISLK